MKSCGQTTFIILCISCLSLVSMLLGAYLLLKGFQSGELLVTNGGVAGLSGLIGYLGGNKQQQQTQEPETVKESLLGQPQPETKP